MNDPVLHTVFKSINNLQQIGLNLKFGESFSPFEQLI
jgi:hypothetical protein